MNDTSRKLISSCSFVFLHVCLRLFAFIRQLQILSVKSIPESDARRVSIEFSTSRQYPGNVQVRPTRVFHEARTNALGSQEGGRARRTPSCSQARTSSSPSTALNRRTWHWKRRAARPRTPRTTARRWTRPALRLVVVSHSSDVSGRRDSARHTTRGCPRRWKGNIAGRRAKMTLSIVIWTPRRLSHLAWTKLVCPIRITRSICPSTRPLKPSTCSIIKRARLSRKDCTCSWNILAGGSASSTISLCEYFWCSFYERGSISVRCCDG